MQWSMDARIKAQIEKITQEIIDTRGASQSQLKEFFASDEMRRRMLEGFDRMMDRNNTPALRCMEEAQTD